MTLGGSELVVFEWAVALATDANCFVSVDFVIGKFINFNEGNRVSVEFVEVVGVNGVERLAFRESRSRGQPRANSFA